MSRAVAALLVVLTAGCPPTPAPPQPPARTAPVAPPGAPAPDSEIGELVPVEGDA